jgi:hypothetical protein
MKKKLILIVICILSFCSGAYAADKVYVQTKSGTKELALDNVATIKFSEEGSVLFTHVAGESTVVEASDFVAITFDVPSGINDLLNNEIGLRFDGDTLFFNGTLTIYNADGKIIVSSNSGSLSIAEFASGIYIAKTNESTLKFVKQ